MTAFAALEPVCPGVLLVPLFTRQVLCEKLAAQRTSESE
jgi:hypothetical protein